MTQWYFQGWTEGRKGSSQVGGTSHVPSTGFLRGGRGWRERVTALPEGQVVT